MFKPDPCLVGEPRVASSPRCLPRRSLRFVPGVTPPEFILGPQPSRILRGDQRAFQQQNTVRPGSFVRQGLVDLVIADPPLHSIFLEGTPHDVRIRRRFKIPKLR